MNRISFFRMPPPQFAPPTGFHAAQRAQISASSTLARELALFFQFRSREKNGTFWWILEHRSSRPSVSSFRFLAARDGARNPPLTSTCRAAQSGGEFLIRAGFSPVLTQPATTKNSKLIWIVFFRAARVFPRALSPGGLAGLRS
jgi:hypothetical protein